MPSAGSRTGNPTEGAALESSSEPDPRETRFGEIVLYVVRLIAAVTVFALVIGWLLR